MKKRTTPARKAAHKKDIWEQLEEHRKNPAYVKAVREFIRKTTS